MPKGAYTQKQERKADHIAEGYRDKGVSKKEAEERAWRTVNKQDKGGKKFLDFHQKLLGGRGQADKTRALAAAKEAGLDLARIEKDLQSPEVKANLEEVMQLAEALGINGTPTYVVGENIIPGAVGVAALQQQVAGVRSGAR